MRERKNEEGRVYFERHVMFSVTNNWKGNIESKIRRRKRNERVIVECVGNEAECIVIFCGNRKESHVRKT